MINHESDAKLQAKLNSVDVAIAAHPLSSESVKSAHAIIEATGKDDKELVERKLAEEGLPGLEELGKMQLRGTMSLLKLGRERNKVVKKIEKLTK